MTPLPQSCERFRAEWLAGGAVGSAGADAHASGCASCTEWVRGAQLQLRAFEDLRPVAAPAALDARMDPVLRSPAEQDDARLADAVASLEPRRAPARLDALVAAGLAGDEPEAQESEEIPAAVKLLTTLDRRRAPAVLERLVDEELRAPVDARARRFVGDLPRMHAPAALDRRVAGSLRARLRPRWIAPVAALAAAVLAVWIGVGGPGGEGVPDTGEREYSFRVVRAGDGARPGALPLAIGEALTGGPVSVPTLSNRRPR